MKFIKRKKNHSSSQEKNFDYSQAKMNQAIALCALKLGHEVRRPFSMLQTIFAELREADTYEQQKQLTCEYIPQIEKAIEDVNIMLRDISDAGRPMKITPRKINLQELIENVLKTNKINCRQDVTFSYLFHHTSLVSIDESRMGRVISNIIENALEAMEVNGIIWFTTQDWIQDGKKAIKLIIGNSNSYIPSEDIESIFETFYTKDKKSGTGLGLAIAKKTVEAHGGSICCRSDQEFGIEFEIILPLQENDQELLPKHREQNNTPTNF